MTAMTTDRHPDTTEGIVASTREWVEKVVVGLGFCPFAARPFLEDRIRYAVLPDEGIARALEDLLAEAAVLDHTPGIETTLAILPVGYESFEDYLDLLALAEESFLEMGYEGVYQIASFHPQYRFEGHEPDDPANYTNRSPYPMLHLIREDSITRALAHYPDPENIPLRNKALARSLGLGREGRTSDQEPRPFPGCRHFESP